MPKVLWEAPPIFPGRNPQPVYEKLDRKTDSPARRSGRNLEAIEGQMSLLDQHRSERWSKAMAAADALRDKFGEQAVSLAASLKGRFRERVHENPAAIPGKKPRQL